jgi:hypothetical protein
MLDKVLTGENVKVNGRRHILRTLQSKQKNFEKFKRKNKQGNR